MTLSNCLQFRLSDAKLYILILFKSWCVYYKLTLTFNSPIMCTLELCLRWVPLTYPYNDTFLSHLGFCRMSSGSVSSSILKTKTPNKEENYLLG